MSKKTLTTPPDKKEELPEQKERSDSPEVVERKAEIQAACEDYARRTGSTAALAEQAAAIADPRKAKKMFVKEYAPILARIVQHGAPSDNDKAAAGKLFEKQYPADWLKERLEHYENGGGMEFRKDDATAFWILNKLSDEQARAMVPKVDAWDALPRFRADDL